MIPQMTVVFAYIKPIPYKVPHGMKDVWLQPQLHDIPSRIVYKV